MTRKLSIFNRAFGRIFRTGIPLSKVRTVFGLNIIGETENHIKLTLELYDKDPCISYLKTPLYDFLKNFSPSKLKDYIPGIETELPIFKFPWGELISGMSQKDMWNSRFCGPSTDEFIEDEYKRIIALYESIKTNGYRPNETNGGFSAGTFLLDRDFDYRFIVLQGNHRSPILAHLGYEKLNVSIFPFYIRPYVFINHASKWVHVKDQQCSLEDARNIFSFYFKQ